LSIFSKIIIIKKGFLGFPCSFLSF
jgi:hypothetical protein